MTARTLRVLLVVEAASAGVGRHVLDLGEGLVERDIEVQLVVGGARADVRFRERLAALPALDVHFVDAHGAGRSTPAVIRHVRHIARTCGCNIVHGHASFGGAWARLGHPRSSSVVYTPNALVTQSPAIRPVARTLYGLTERVLSRRTDAVIYVSDEEATHGIELGLRPRMSTVIPNGIKITSPPDALAARRSLGLELGRPTVGFVGRLTSQKGLDHLVRATPSIISDTGAVIAVVGAGPDERELRQLADNLGVTANMIWLGDRDGARAMGAFDVLAVPSRYEGFPYVVLESLAAGVPVVASPAANVSGVLACGPCGVVAEPTTDGFGRAIVSLLRDAGQRAALGASGRVTVAGLSVDSMVDATIDVYMRVVGP